MNNNPIRKMHVGWQHSWTLSISATPPTSVREWVAVCPKCKIVGRTPQTSHYAGTGKNTRKAAKDALHYHMKTFH
jgi:hypothetical protein